MKVELDFDIPLYYVYYNHGKAVVSKRAHKIVSATVTRKAITYILRGCRAIQDNLSTSPNRDALSHYCDLENIIWSKPKNKPYGINMFIVKSKEEK